MFGLMVVTILGAAACAGMQPSPSAAPSAAARPGGGVPALAGVAPAISAVVPLPGDVRLGTGDLIEVSVFDVPELSSLKARIPASGTITLPLLGAVTAAGQTAGQLQAHLRQRLQARYMHDPQLTVFVLEHKSQRIYVGGAVKSPGAHELVGRARVADALAMAGGLTEDAGRSVQLTRRRPDTASVVTVMIDLDRVTAADDEANIEVLGGDVLDVGRAGTYYVGGEVGRPGSFALKSRTTVAQAVVNAGGVKDVADWDDVRVYRRRPDGSTDVQTFSLNEFEAGKPSSEVQLDDVVIVGKSGMKAFLYGVRDFLRFGIGASIPIL
jgi:polysaccharide export outer membrane protein